MVRLINLAQELKLKNIEIIIRKLNNSATIIITETILIKGVNKELIKSANYQKNCKKASIKGTDKISDARVLSL
jgi:hypothetical protein